MFIILFFFVYFSSCINIKNEKHHINITKAFKSYTNSIYLKVSFNNTFISFYNYLNIQIENNQKTELGQIAFYSKYDYDCMPDREQMSINPYGDNFMVISKDKLTDYNEEKIIKNQFSYKYDVFYLCIYCLEERCNYTVNFELTSSININNTKYYNYLVNEDNKKFIFSFVSNKNNKAIVYDYIDTYELYWIKRMKNNKYINFNNILPEKYNGILFENIKNENEIINFTINSYVNDYITIGRSIIIGNTNIEPLRINDIETIGYLETKSKFNEECFKIEKIEGKRNVYIKGIFYDKLVGISYKELESEKIISEIKIKEGNFIEYLPENFKNGAKICVSLLDESNEEYYTYDNITFIIQLFSNQNKKYNYYYNTFELPGYFYTIDLGLDEILVLSGIITKHKNVSITVNAIYGLPKIYIDDCKKFPFCKYEDSFDLANLEEVKTNKMNSYTSIYNTKGDNNILGSFNPLLIIYCPFSNNCFFSATYFNEEDFIILREEALFNQYLLKEEKNNFIINYKNQKNIKQIIVDLIIFNGDIQIELNCKEKLFILNKFIYIIDANSEELLKNNKKLKITITGIKNSFYSLKYKLIRKNVDNNNIKMLYNRVNNIEYLDANKNLFIDSLGPKISLNLIFFYSPNCKFNISKNNQILETYLFNNYYQGIIDSSDSSSYNLFFYKSHPVNYKDKKCILYSNKILDIDESNEIGERIEDLLIIENSPQIYLFNYFFSSIIYKYPNIDNERDLIINIRVINHGYYYIYIYNNLKNIIDIEYFFSNQIIYLEKQKLTNINSLKIEVEINKYTLIEDNKNNNKHLLEISVRQVKNKFFYLEKGKIKKDLVVKDNNLFLYMDIEEKDEGYIMVDFYKLKGEIYGKLISKKQNQIIMNNEVYWEKINGKIISKYDFYMKKLLFSKEDTSNCTDGCYLLISIKIQDIHEMLKETELFPISIMTTLINDNILNLSTIKFDFNDYIIGYLHNNNSELYEFNIPYDGDSIEIVYYSDKVKLLVYIENNNNEINYDKPNFIIKPGNKIFNIPKGNITNITNTSRIDNIIILFYACIDNDYTNEPIKNINNLDYFIFKVFIHQKDELKIYKINSEQKIMCQPQIIDGQNICLFFVEITDFIYDNYTIFYAKSQNSTLNMYGIINSLYYYFDMNYYSNYIPNEENAEYNNKINNKTVDFIVFDKRYYLFERENFYLYISVFSNSSNTIEFIATSYNYYNGLIPNPNIKQFYALDNNLENKINLHFLTQNPLVINIEALNGKGELYFNNKLYNFEENNNKISFILNSDVNENIEFKLKNEDNTTSINEDIIIPELVFYVEYYYRSPINLDKVKFEDIWEISYKNPTFPLYIYSEIEKYEQDINIYFEFNRITLKNESQLKMSKNLNISSFIIDKRNILDYINNKQNYLENFKVIIDPLIGIGQIYIPKGIINKYKSNKDSTIFLAIENKNKENDIIYEEINIKSYIIKEQSAIPIFENVYYYGKIMDINKINKYKLKLDNPKDYIYIQFSANSKMVNFTFSIFDNKGINVPYYDYKYEEKDGKINVFLKNNNKFSFIYLDIYWDNNKKVNENFIPKLNNYVFKIITFNDINKKYNYKIKENNKIECILTKSRNNNTMEIIINKIENHTKYDIIYSLKIIKSNDFINGELYNTIALTESISNIIQIKKNKNDDNDSKVIFHLQDIKDHFEDNFEYIEVIAQITDEYNNEYIAYEPIKSKEEIKINITIETTTIIIIIFEILSIIIVISLIIFLIYLKRKVISEKNNDDKKVKIKPLIKYDDIIIGKNEEEDDDE